MFQELGDAMPLCQDKLLDASLHNVCLCIAGDKPING